MAIRHLIVRNQLGSAAGGIPFIFRRGLSGVAGAATTSLRTLRRAFGRMIGARRGGGRRG